MTRRRRVHFIGRKIVKVPVRVSFRTYDGERVSFNATKAVVKRRHISFYARRRKRRW
jgi:hypothetical protein